MRVYARFFSVYVVYANRVGYEDGVHFWGGSQVVAPGGNTVAKAGYGTEELLVATIEPEVVRRHRIFSPLGRDEKIDLTMRELARVARARDEVECDHDS